MLEAYEGNLLEKYAFSDYRFTIDEANEGMESFGTL
jgi:hypothetical protein